MKWKREEDEKPPFDTQVLAWIECRGCKNNTIHRHNLFGDSHAAPFHGPFLAQYYPEEPETGRPDPRWWPVKPTYWCKIEEP